MTLTRRKFLEASAVAGAWSIAIGAPLRALANGTAAKGPQPSWCVYVAINRDNSTTIMSPVMDMGQFMRTTGPMMIAEELDLDWNRIQFTDDASLHLTRNEKGQLAYAHAHMDTGGSHAVERNWDRLRRAGATARRMLIEEAADRWEVSAHTLRTEPGFVIDPRSSRRLSYAELATAAVNRVVDPASVELKDRADYRIIGTPARNIDARGIVLGKPLFGIDEDYPNALQAVIYRVPAWGGDVVSYDKTAALAVPGVRQVIDVDRVMGKHWLSGETQLTSAGVAVLADDLWSAMKAKSALALEWKNTSPFANQDSEAQLAEFHRILKGDAASEVLQNEGDVETAMSSAQTVLDQVYECPLVAHACMEPFNCIADIRERDATVIVGTQFPLTVAQQVQTLTGIDAMNVRVVGKRMGGGFGRRAEMDYVREAIALSHKVKRPVKVTWMREDEMEQDFFGPAAVMRLRAGMNDGRLVAWHHRQAQTKGGAQDSCFPARLVENYKVELCKYDSHIRAGAWRPPMHLPWSFAVESMFDELAYATQTDPLQFRLDLMKPHKEYPFKGWGAEIIDTGRMAKCYEAAAKMAQWDRKRPEGTGLGIAGHFTHGSYVAFVIEVSVSEQNELKLHQAWGAIDCGLPINPNHIRNQMQGGFIDGLNAALFNKANVKEGRVQQNNFGAFRWMRMREAPLDIHVTIIENGYKPTGVGEPPTPPAPAALANAIFAASGKRVRRLPIAESVKI